MPWYPKSCQVYILIFFFYFKASASDILTALIYISHFSTLHCAHISISVSVTSTHIFRCPDRAHQRCSWTCLLTVRLSVWQTAEMTGWWIIAVYEGDKSAPPDTSCKLLSLFGRLWHAHDRTDSVDLCWTEKNPHFLNPWFPVNYMCRTVGRQSDLWGRSVGVDQIRHVHEDIYKYP